MTTPRVELPTIAVVGAGSMGRAILAGLLAPNVDVIGGIRVTNRDVERASDFDTEPRVTAFTTGRNPHANRDAVAGASIVLIGVKPAMVTDVLDEIAEALDPHALIVSVAAGVTTRTMEEHLPGGQAVVRTMPNTPATVGRAVTGIAGGSRVTPGDLDLAVRLFETVGDVLVIEEDRIDALGSISGSGPAYLFYFIEQFVRVAEEKGFTREQADLMVRGTFRGAIDLLDASGETPQELRRRVTSPGGSTERAIAVFDAADVHHIFGLATDAAVARQREMGKA
jgi:pyrroline-5-carboxylate reductase